MAAVDGENGSGHVGAPSEHNMSSPGSQYPIVRQSYFIWSESSCPPLNAAREMEQPLKGYVGDEAVCRHYPSAGLTLDTPAG